MPKFLIEVRGTIKKDTIDVYGGDCTVEEGVTDDLLLRILSSPGRMSEYKLSDVKIKRLEE